MKTKELYDIAIIGAGPTGLACGIYAQRAGLSHVVIEKGTVVNTIVGYPKGMTFFSTPERLSIGEIPFPSPHLRPSREEAIAYYRGVAQAEEVHFQLGTKVKGLKHEEGYFVLDTTQGNIEAQYVVLATGYFDHTNRLDVPGEDLPHVHHYYQEPYEHFDQQVLVIGGRNSAVETALDLYRNGAHVTMIHRGESFGKSVKFWVRPDIENRVTSGEIAMFWNTEVAEIGENWVSLRNNHTGKEFRREVDALYAMIGYRPDERLFQKFGIEYDQETLVPYYSPETFETNVPCLYLAGSVACGCKTWEIFIENGREHAKIVIEGIHARTMENS